MTKFFQLVVAAIIGSVITLVANQWYGIENATVKIEHIDSIPASSVAYTVNENGDAIPLDFTGTADRVTPAVVHIRSTQQAGPVSENSRDPLRDFFYGPSPMQRGPSQSTGSGVIINKNGYIVTNNHVVQGADIVDVTLNDNSSYKAEVIGTDPDTDLAVIKINGADMPHLSFVDSDQAKVGQWVLAVGNPFNLNSTVTAGIISAKGRNINIINSNTSDNEQAGNTAIESFIQTDAAINPGNSGGALVSLDGGLIGINTAIASPTGAYSGYGFAVPSNIVSKVVEDLITYGTVQRGWLGVTVQNVSSDLAKREGLDRNEGAFIVDFAESSSAKDAGLKKGDVVIQLDDADVKSSTALIEYIGRKRPGDKINVTVDRKGKIVSMPVTLKNRNGEVATVKRDEKDAVASLGLQLEEVDQKTLNGLELKNGVRVSKLGNGKLSRFTEMHEGFIITHIDDQPVKSVKQINEILKDKKEGDLITFSGIYENFPREYIYALRM